MNQQAIDRVKERLSKYLKRTDDSDKSYDNGYCKALEHTLEDLQALGDGWIPVTDRLPEKFVYVLTIDTEKVQRVLRLQEYDWSMPGNGYGLKDITHWMPLPLLPITK